MKRVQMFLAGAFIAVGSLYAQSSDAEWQAGVAKLKETIQTNPAMIFATCFAVAPDFLLILSAKHSDINSSKFFKAYFETVKPLPMIKLVVNQVRQSTTQLRTRSSTMKIVVMFSLAMSSQQVPTSITMRQSIKHGQ